MLQIELLEPGLPHLAHPGAGEHADPDDAGSAVIFCCIQGFRQTVDLLL
jgi:hypothetical protein